MCFFHGEIPEIPDDDFSNYADNFIDGFEIPTEKTIYINFCFHVPSNALPQPDLHIVRISWLEDPETVGFVHHALIYGKKYEFDMF